jgi:peptide/nickel transport system permease protein
VVLGTFSAKNRKKGSDKIMMMYMIAFAEIPSYLLGLILLLVFSVYLRLFPLAGAVTPFAEYAGPVEQAWDILYHACRNFITFTIDRCVHAHQKYPGHSNHKGLYQDCPGQRTG